MTAILILLGLMLAAFLLGWLISRLLNKSGDSDSDGLATQISEKEAALEACQKNHSSLTAKLSAANSLVADVAAPIAVAPIVAPVVTTILEDTRMDDLKIVEGIGPKIEELLQNAGIKTFAKLASTSVSDINAILEAAGPRYQMHDPSTWPQQSALCRDGQWTALKTLQDELNKGKVE